jgi:hypothetical protein
VWRKASSLLIILLLFSPHEQAPHEVVTMLNKVGILRTLIISKMLCLEGALVQEQGSGHF